MTAEKVQKIFPKDFPIDKLPKGAKEETLLVYRICRTGKVEEASFLPTYMDELAKIKEYDETDDHDIGFYSLSTYEKTRDAKNKLKFFRGKEPNAIVAQGTTEGCCGVIQRTRERTGQKDSHVDWWLYNDATPHIYFQEVKLDEKGALT